MQEAAAAAADTPHVERDTSQENIDKMFAAHPGALPQHHRLAEDTKPDPPNKRRKRDETEQEHKEDTSLEAQPSTPKRQRKRKPRTPKRKERKDVTKSPKATPKRKGTPKKGTPKKKRTPKKATPKRKSTPKKKEKKTAPNYQDCVFLLGLVGGFCTYIP